MEARQDRQTLAGPVAAQGRDCSGLQILGVTDLLQRSPVLETDELDSHFDRRHAPLPEVTGFASAAADEAAALGLHISQYEFVNWHSGLYLCLTSLVKESTSEGSIRSSGATPAASESLS